MKILQSKPRINLKSLLETHCVAFTLISFLGINEILNLNLLCKDIKMTLFCRPELFGYADFYQFNSRFPEWHALRFWKFLYDKRATLRNMRMIFCESEVCIPYSLLLRCNLNNLESLILKQKSARYGGSVHLVCHAHEMSLKSNIVDMTEHLRPFDSDTLGVHNYLKSFLNIYEHPPMNFCLLTLLSAETRSRCK